MKQLFLTLTLLIPCFGGPVLAQTGMTVFGDCYVAETAAIGFFGEDLILQADVAGEGDLILAGQKPQTITAHDQAIHHLVVRNPAGVKVKGKLTVRRSLTILQGILDVLPLSELTIDPQARVLVAAGSSLTSAGALWQTGKSQLPSHRQGANGNEALLTTTGVRTVFPVESFLTQPIRTPFAYQNPDPQTETTPPRWA